jgi:hypothetical protein
MGFAATESTIRSRFNTQWASLRPTIPVFFDNAGDDVQPPQNSAWVRLTVLPGASQQVEMGRLRRWRRAGIIAVQIFVPAASGTGLAQELGDTVRDIFEGLTVSSVIFRATSLNRVGLDGAWLRYNANTPFQADELR